MVNKRSKKKYSVNIAYIEYSLILLVPPECYEPIYYIVLDSRNSRKFYKS